MLHFHHWITIPKWCRHLHTSSVYVGARQRDIGMYLCIRMCIVRNLHKLKHMLSICVLGMDRCLCGCYSFTSPSLNGDSQIQLKILPKLQQEFDFTLSFFFFFFFFFYGCSGDIQSDKFLYEIYGLPRSGSREGFTPLYIQV